MKLSLIRVILFSGKNNLTQTKETLIKDTVYDHAIDWSIINMAIARMTKKSNKIIAIDVPSDIAELRVYFFRWWIRGWVCVD